VSIAEITASQARRAMSVLVLMLAIAVMVIGTAKPAHAITRQTSPGTGGCWEHAGGGKAIPNGWPAGSTVMHLDGSPDTNVPVEMGVCINNRSHHAVAFPDVYVNVPPPSGPGISCTLVVELWNGNDHLGGTSSSGPCSGHLDLYGGGGWGLTAPGLGKFCTSPNIHASAYMIYNRTFYRIGDSPSFQYCGDL
jgi:hypothetical protein